MRTVELGTVAAVERKGVDPSSLAPSTLYLGLEHIERGGRIIGHDTVGRAEIASTKFQFTPEHVLFGKLRPNLGKISRPGFVGVCSTDILPIRPGKDLDRDYLAHYLSQPSMVDFATSRTSGANLPRLSPAVLATFPIPLPPLAEQRRIAAILDHVDALRAKRRQLFLHLDTLTQSIFHDMFKDTTAEAPLGDQLDFLTSGSRGWARYYSESGAKFLRIQNVRNDRLSLDDLAYVDAPDSAEARRTRVQAGDVLLSITADLGRTAVVPEDIGRAYINQHLSILRAPEIAPRYLSAYLSSPSGQHGLAARNRAAVKAGLNFDDIRSLRVPLPSRAAQDDFARRAAAVDDLRARHERATNLDAQLFSSLQHRAFRGQL